MYILVFTLGIVSGLVLIAIARLLSRARARKAYKHLNHSRIVTTWRRY